MTQPQLNSTQLEHIREAFSDEAELFKEVGAAFEKIADRTKVLITEAKKIAEMDKLEDTKKIEKFRKQFLEEDLFIRMKLRSMLENKRFRTSMGPEVVSFLKKFFNELGIVEHQLQKSA